MKCSFKIHPADRVFMAIVATYIVICWVVTLISGYANRFMPLMYLGAAAQITLLGLSIYILYRLLRALWIMLTLAFPSLRTPRKRGEAIHPPGDGLLRRVAPRNDDSITKILLADLKSGPLRRELWRRALPLFIAFVFFFSTFTSMKFLIADIHPFTWDVYLMQADRFIHFGHDPWRILQPVLGHPFITFIIGFFYILWLPVFFLVLYWQLFRFKDDALRMRFFYTFAMSWAINGTFLAIVFSSAGPCYFENVIGSAHYVPLMDYLRGANERYKIFSVFTQDLLWKHYMDKSILIGGGISAFPSVHVATTFLFVLMARHVNKFAFTVFLVFFMIIFLGSIHLGWHYAVDGYFAILTTAVLWGLTGRFTQLYSR